MHHGVGKTYIKRERKWNIICTLAVLLVMAVVIGIFELLPGDSPELGYSEMNGLGRSFMYPFVFTDSRDDLYVMKDDMSVTAVDDSVSSPVYDILNDDVYYIKDNSLYEYSLKSNDRTVLDENTVEFSLLGNRRAIICKSGSGVLKIYMFKGNRTERLTDTDENTAGVHSYCVSDEGVLFSDGARLMYADYLGRTKEISGSLNASRKFYISDDGNLICYYEDNTMYIKDSDGETKYRGENVGPVLYQQSPVFISPSTSERESGDGVPLRYFIKDIGTSGENTVGTLQYFTGEEMKTVAENVYKVIYYSRDDDFILYSVPDGSGMTVYMSTGGRTPVRQIQCGTDYNFIFDDRTNYLYYQDSDSALYRYDIYDVNVKTVKVADSSGNIFDYYNRPFVVYEDAVSDEIYIVLKDKIERINSKAEMRLYGRNSDTYLLCRQNADGNMTIDYVSGDRLTRIAGDAGASVFFDRDIENIIYNENDSLYVWRNGISTNAGNYRNIKATDVIK